MRVIQNIIKWFTLTFFGVVLFTFSIAQFVPIEFADWNDMHLFYDIILWGLPIIVLSTLIWTVKRSNNKRKNVLIIVFTPIIAIATLFLSFNLMFVYGFGAWVDQKIIYVDKNNPDISIREQMWDIGAFGYGGSRTVKLTPISGLFNFVQEIDTNDLNKDNWRKVKVSESMTFP